MFILQNKEPVVRVALLKEIFFLDRVKLQAELFLDIELNRYALLTFISI